MPVCLSLNKKSLREELRPTQIFPYTELLEKTGFFSSQVRKAMGVFYQNRPKDMFIDETVYFVLILKLCFMCLKSTSLHVSCFLFFFLFFSVKFP